MNPYGGTEIQLEYLNKYVSKDLLNKVQITTSVPEKDKLAMDKPNLLWVHNSYDQANLMPWFQSKLNHGKYDYYVFNSHWTYEKYRYFFSIPTELCSVIKNGFDDDLIIRTDFKPKDKIKLIYTSTPWRGLDVLLNAMEQIKTDKIELDQDMDAAVQAIIADVTFIVFRPTRINVTQDLRYVVTDSGKVRIIEKTVTPDDTEDIEESIEEQY